MPSRPSSRRSLQRHKTIAFAQVLRRRSTKAEYILWKALRNRQCAGIKFRRQVPFGLFVADFCSIDPRLIIEVDGGIHRARSEYDAMRDQILRERGFAVLRFSNHQILSDLHSCLLAIATTAAKLRTEQ